MLKKALDPRQVQQAKCPAPAQCSAFGCAMSGEFKELVSAFLPETSGAELVQGIELARARSSAAPFTSSFCPYPYSLSIYSVANIRG